MDVDDQPCTHLWRCRVAAPWQGHGRRRAGRDSPDLCRCSRRARGAELHRDRNRIPRLLPVTRHGCDPVPVFPLHRWVGHVRLVRRRGCPSCCGALRARGRGGRQSRWAPVCSSWPWACTGSGITAVAFRAGDLDPQIARYAFDQGQAAFANGRVALGSFAVCCGWVIASTRFLPRWVGWLAISSGAGLALSRISWTSYIWMLGAMPPPSSASPSSASPVFPDVSQPCLEGRPTPEGGS
jgi:hypothetical protein